MFSPSYPYTPDTICFSMLRRQALPERYLDSHHYGPRMKTGTYSADNARIALIISRDKLLAAYPGQVFAVGSSFRDNSLMSRLSHGRVTRGQSVEGIPVKHPGSDPVVDDEVRLYSSKGGGGVVVTPGMYEGLVVLPTSFYDLKWLMKDIPLQFELPIFSPQCELLSIAQKSK